MMLPVDVVIGVENTRAASLSWDERTRREFTEELRRRLAGESDVGLIQETSLTMGQVLPRR